MLDLIAPATGKKFAIVKTDSEDTLRQAVSRAVVAQKKWIELTFRQRERVLIEIREYLVRNSDEIASMIAECTGKTPVDAFATEVLPATLSIGYYLKAIPPLMQPQKIKLSSIAFFNKQSNLVHEPWGVIGIISPWNYPFGIPFHETIMALVAGNAVILKVATQAQPIGDLFSQMMSAVGLPDGLFTNINMAGSDAGAAFLSSGIHKLFFTGSIEIGQELMKLASDRLIPVSLELGGNDAMIVCADAPIKRAAAGAVWGGISNCGQSCGGVARIYVMESVYDAFMAELDLAVKSLRPGVGVEADIGSLTTQKMVRTVDAHIKDALSKGAKIRCTSNRGNGDLFHEAVVLENCTHDMDVIQKETFGPVLAVCRVKSEEEAIRLANDSNLGLTASVWTKNRQKASQLASQLQVGAVTINDHLMSHGMAETPWGGYKMSSIGRSHGGPGLTEVLQSKVIIHDLTAFLPRNIWWHPYSNTVYNGLKFVMLALFIKNPFKKIIYTLQLIRFYLSRILK